MTKKLVALMTVAATAGLAALPASASAQNTLACQVGLVGRFMPGVQLGDTRGTYLLGTPAGSTGTRCSLSGAPQNATVSSQGSFRTVVCGTGEMWSDQGGPRDNGSHTMSIAPLGITSVRYTITLVGWQGVIDITHVNGVPEQLPRNGNVTILPATGETCEPDPSDLTGPGVNSFDLVGAFVARW